MAASPPHTHFVYPDPTYYGLRQSYSDYLTSFGGVNTLAGPPNADFATPHGPNFAMYGGPEPASARLLPHASAHGLAHPPMIAAPAPYTGPPCPLSAAGRQPFPTLSPGQQAPIELTNKEDKAKWDKNIRGNIPPVWHFEGSYFD